MKKILYLLLLISNIAISQIKLAQLEPCRTSTGTLIDSCCVITGANGFLKYLTIEQCQALYQTKIEIVDSVVLVNGIPLNDFCDAVKKCETKTTLVNNANGTYQYVNEGGTISVLGYNLTCVNDSTIQLRDNDGTVVTTCVLRGAATPPVPIAVDTLIVQADSTLTVQTTDGNQYTLDLCDIVKKCETNIIVLNNIDGTYTIVNENGFPTVLGYRLQCVNDSTIAITDNDGTLINQCMLKGGANPSVPIAIDTLIIASDSTVTVQTTDGNQYTLDLCNVVKKCETSTNIVWNTTTNEYYYTNEKGNIDTVSFSIGWNPVSEEIFHINHNGDTTSKISACDLVCTNMVSATDDNYSTNDCTVPYCSNVITNDSPCSPGPTTSIALIGMATNGTVTIDVNGNFCFTFLSCDPTDNYGFTYQITCPDGTTTTAVVTIDLISTCPSNAALEDFVLAFKNTATNFNVAVNDLSCTDRTYTLFTNPVNGTIFFNPNGSGIYNPNSGYMGLDSCIVELHCNGQSCDTSWLKFLVLENAPADSTYYLFAGQTLNGDASLNDIPCTPPSTTSFAWTNSLTPSYAGTLAGTPTSWTYVSSPSYCGDSYREYEQICTPPGAPGTKAKEMFKSVCASGVPDFITILDDTIGTFNVSSNDLSCTNGAATTWHLFQQPSFSGTKTHGAANDTLWLYSCKGNCPVTNPSPSDKIGHIHSWDTLTGNMSYWIPKDYEGDLCFRYFMRCKLPSGTWKNDDTVCVAITREITPAFADIQIATPDTTIPSLRINFTGFCGESPTQTALVAGDKIHVNIQTDCGQTVDVDLIVGQNIKLPAGYTNDVGGKWASLIVPSITTTAPLMTNGGLLIGSFFFDLRKDTLAKLSNCWGDGLVNVNRIGSQWRWNLSVGEAFNCAPSAIVRDTIQKMYTTLMTGISIGSVNCPSVISMVHHTAIGTFDNASFPDPWEVANINSTNTDYWVTGGASSQPCTPSYNPVIGALVDLPDCSGLGFTFGYINAVMPYMHNHTDVTVKSHPYYSGNIQYPNHHLITNTYHGADNRFSNPRVYWAKNNVPLGTGLKTSIYSKTIIYNGCVMYQSTSFPSQPIDHKVWIGNNPLDLSVTGSPNRTNILTDIYVNSSGWWNQGSGNGAYRQVDGKYTLPTEGFYNYSNYFSTGGRPEFEYGHGSVNLFSY
jgi:hypothetical protein